MKRLFLEKNLQNALFYTLHGTSIYMWGACAAKKREGPPLPPRPTLAPPEPAASSYFFYPSIFP